MVAVLKFSKALKQLSVVTIAKPAAVPGKTADFIGVFEDGRGGEI
jgi:hypothetical protein